MVRVKGGLLGVGLKKYLKNKHAYPALEKVYLLFDVKMMVFTKKFVQHKNVKPLAPN